MKFIGRHKRLFNEYFSIEDSNHQSKISFYEKHLEEINQITQQEKLEIDADYNNALFVKGKFVKCLVKTQDLLETVIRENIYTLKEEDIYQNLLFRKAACHFNIGESNQCLDVLGQLIKISPPNDTYTAFYKKCFRTLYMAEKRWMGGLAIALFLTAAILISGELLVVRPFYANHVEAVEMLRNSLFLVAICFLVIRERAYFKAINQKLNNLK